MSNTEPTAKPGLPKETIAVVGLGYVGLPLAVSLCEKYGPVTGFDISADRVAALNAGEDATNEIARDRLVASGLRATNDAAALSGASFYIVTVPTPITDSKQPNLDPLRGACQTIGPHLAKGDVVVFESTVYPGVTEDVCGPILADLSGLTPSQDFYLGYSPERINPGDKVNTVETIIKNIAADRPETLDRLEAVYGQIVDAGTFRCTSIKVAEAAKVLENTQRDINIALMNELSLICQRIGVPTLEVIEAAASKWNFVPFYPGLVGGHCIGVDPYYLAYLGQKLGLHPDVILAGRRINDAMTHEISAELIKRLVSRGGSVRSARVACLGVTFKENVPDLRNSKAIELIETLRQYGLDVLVHDPVCSVPEVRSLGLEIVGRDEIRDLDCLILAAPHKTFLDDDALLDSLKPNAIFADIKGVFRKADLPPTVDYWML